MRAYNASKQGPHAIAKFQQRLERNSASGATSEFIEERVPGPSWDKYPPGPPPLSRERPAPKGRFCCCADWIRRERRRRDLDRRMRHLEGSSGVTTARENDVAKALAELARPGSMTVRGAFLTSMATAPAKAKMRAERNMLLGRA